MGIARITKYGGDYNGGQCAEFSGLEKGEVDMMHSAAGGQAWITVDDNGRVKSAPTREPLPGLTEDLAMAPFWRRHQDVQAKLELNDFESLEAYSSPHFVVQHLCGYRYSLENYQMQAARLERFGFQCMRSKRAADGKFWEIWFLPGAWAAQNELKEVCSKFKMDERKEMVKAVTSFLARNCSFGTLDVSVQKLAMVIE